MVLWTLPGTYKSNVANGYGDPVELRRLNFQTAAMQEHPPISVAKLASHIEALKANDNQQFSLEYEVSRILKNNISKM